MYNQKRTSFLSKVDKLSKGEIYLPVSLASKYDCDIDDEVKIETKSFSKNFHIKGFVEEPTMGNPVIGGYKNVFISQEDFDTLYEEYEKATGELIACDIIQVYVKDGSKLTDHQLSSLLNDTKGERINVLRYKTMWQKNKRSTTSKGLHPGAAVFP